MFRHWRTRASNPYMWYGGTVPTRQAGASSGSSRTRAVTLRVTSPPQYLRCPTGCPVLPEVNTSATNASGLITGLAHTPTGTAAGKTARVSGTINPPRGRSSLSASPSTLTHSALCSRARSTSRVGFRSLLSRTYCPRSNVAAKSRVKWLMLEHTGTTG